MDNLNLKQKQILEETTVKLQEQTGNEESQNDSISHKSAKGVKNSLFSEAVMMALTLSKTFIFTLFIAPEHFGLIAIVIIISGFVQLIQDFGYSSYIIQKPKFERGELNFLYTRVLFMGIVAFLIVLAITVPSARFYDHRELLWIMPIAALQFVSNSIILVPLSLLKKELEFHKIARINILSTLGSVLLGFGLLLFVRNYWVLLASQVSQYVLMIPLVFYYNKTRFRLVNPFDKHLNRHSIHFGSFMAVYNIITFISMFVDKLIIGKIAGSAVLGIYSKSYDLGVSNMNRIYSPLQNVYFSALAKNEEPRENTLFQFAFLINAILFFLIGPLMICQDWLINSILGDSWKEMTAILPPFLLSAFLATTVNLTDRMLIIENNLKRYLGFGITKAIIATAAIIIGCFWGAQMMAWCFFLYQLIFMVPFMNTILKGSGFEKAERRRVIKNLTLIVLSAIASIALPWWLVDQGIVGIPVGFTILFACGFMVHIMLWPLIHSYKNFKEFTKLLFKFRDLSNA